MDKDWWKRSVVYQIYPRSFNDSDNDGIGDIPGITEKLPYLKDLGVDVIWLSPVYKSPNDDNGYDISDYRNIMDEFGTMEDFDKMLKTAHDLGLKIMMDVVVNHSSDEHEWFKESRKSEDNPYRDYYIWKKNVDGTPPNNWGGTFGGSAWEYDEPTDSWYLHLFSKKQPDLNWENPKVREEVKDLMRFWLDKGVDGFRFDVISLISKDQDWSDGPLMPNGYGSGWEHYNTGPREHEYLKELRRDVLDDYDTITVGECPGVNAHQALDYANLDGSELNMIFTFEHMEADAAKDSKWTDERVYLPKLKAIMGQWQKDLHGKAWNSLYWNNHDQPRVVSRFGNDSDEYREKSAKMLAMILHMMEGTPYIYQGEELGMTNYPFQSLDEFRDLESLNAYKEFTEKGVETPEQMFKNISWKGRDNARTPMQWDDSRNGGFTEGEPWIPVNPNYTKINAKEEMNRPDSVYNFYKNLLKMRKGMDVVFDGEFEMIEPDSEDIFAYTRKNDDTELLVVGNFTDHPVEFHVPDNMETGKVILSNEDVTPAKDMTLSPYEGFVIEKKL